MTFSRKQIITTLLVAGPLSASLLVAKNYKNSGHKSTWIEITGFFLLLLMYTIIGLIVEATIAKKDFADNHSGLMNTMAAGIIAVVQAGYGLLIWNIFKKRITRYISESTDTYSNYHLIPRFIVGLGLTTMLVLFGPFRFFFLMVYMVPHYYLFKRINAGFTGDKARRTIYVVLVGLMLLFPVVEIIYNYLNTAVVRTLLVASYYYLPFVLYFFVGLVIYDLVTGSTTQLKLISGSAVYEKKNWRTALGIIAVLALIVTIYAGINFNSPSYTTYNLEVENPTAANKELKVAVASDFHFAEITSKNFLSRFIKKINDIEADIILFPGDIVESDNDNAKMTYIAGELRKIKAKHGVYGSLGNHEYYGDLQKNIQFCKNAGINMLMDSAVVIDNRFILAGQNDMHADERKTLEKIIETSNSDLPVILMRHRPVNFADAVNNNVSLMVSGHTHHGQLFPFHLLTQMFYELSWGHLKQDNTNFITTSGAQGWGPQTRTTGKSEIVVVNILFK